MLGVLRSTWRKKDKSLAPIDEAPPRRPRQSSQTLPRGMGYNVDTPYDPSFPVHGGGSTSRRPARPADPLYPDVFSANHEPLTARPRARSVGAQHAPPLAASHSFPLVGDGVPDLPPLPVTRPPRKSSLASSPLTSPLTSPVAATFGRDARPSMTRVASASAVQTAPPRPRKGSMPDLTLMFTPEQRPTGRTPASPRDLGDMDTPTKLSSRSRSGSTASYSGQRYREAPSSPSPRPALAKMPSSSQYPPIDLTSPAKTRFQPDMTAPVASRSSAGSSLAYLRDGTPPAELSTLPSSDDHLPELDVDDGRSSTPGSLMFDDDTLSLFPQPPPLNLRYIPSRPASPSQYPITPEYTPSATPTSATFFSPSHHAKRVSPPTSILKKSPAYLHSLPSPPITPSTPSQLSPSSSSASFASSFNLPEQMTPMLRVRNSSPQLLSSKMHSVHRPSSSDSSTDKYGYQMPAEYDLRKQALSRPERPQLLDAFQLAVVQEALPPTRPSSPEPDSQRVQWGYAV
ncbi:hypothetical protein HWV62_18230 [Athelia sp. TMB]|nr:hypothetical protein HWV62_18230 [Athelia sp. TMB]